MIVHYFQALGAGETEKGSSMDAAALLWTFGPRGDPGWVSCGQAGRPCELSPKDSITVKPVGK